MRSSVAFSQLITLFLLPLLATAKVTEIFQHAHNKTWFENIALGPNENLFVTRMDTPELWTIDLPMGHAELWHRIPDAKAVMGITPITESLYAIVAGNLTLTDPGVLATPEYGSWSIWTVEVPLPGHKKPKHALRHITRIKESGWLNGIAYDEHSKQLFVADSKQGVIWKVDPFGKHSYSVALKDPSMDPSDALPVGVNGVHILHGFIYFTSSGTEGLYRSPLHGKGKVEKIRGDLSADDFALASDGTAYIAGNMDNAVMEVSPDGKSAVTIAGGKDSSEVIGGTSAVISRDRKVLYVATCGGYVVPLNGKIEPGKVVAIDL